jgi:hypothetical protein
MKLAFLSMFFHPLPKGSPWFTATPNTFLPQDCFVKGKGTEKKRKMSIHLQRLRGGGPFIREA